MYKVEEAAGVFLGGESGPLFWSGAFLGGRAMTRGV